MRCIRVSSSIANFKEKLEKKYEGYSRWNLLRLATPTVFFGLYHVGDYVRFLLHRGRKTVFWCGSDILSLRKSPWQRFIRTSRARHVCENSVEQALLAQMGIYAATFPACFDDMSDIKINFQPTKRRHVYLTAHKGREEEYGVPLVCEIAYLFPEITFHVYGVDGQLQDNVFFHGKVLNKQFNEEIKSYHAALRLNRVDGFSETLAKSALMGQYPMSLIHYPHVIHVPTKKALIDNLKLLQSYKEPNHKAAEYWREVLISRVEA